MTFYHEKSGSLKAGLKRVSDIGISNNFGLKQTTSTFGESLLTVPKRNKMHGGGENKKAWIQGHRQPHLSQPFCIAEFYLLRVQS